VLQGQIDSNGHLSYLGRTNESFQSAGHVIYPSNIEHIVQEFAGIKDCVAFGVPDPYFSNTVGLVFTSEDGVTESLLAAFCREKLPKYSWPYRIIRLSSLPMLSSGKVDRLSIVKTYAS
jgi:acyl-CoA synthetase (AMP-forming)/AMP-acid ligase II